MTGTVLEGQVKVNDVSLIPFRIYVSLYFLNMSLLLTDNRSSLVQTTEKGQIDTDISKAS